MNCKHKPFEFGEIYKFVGLVSSCDTCGNIYTLDSVLLKYTGDFNDAHTFQVLLPFSCAGCHNNVETQKLICGGLPVTEEFKSIYKTK